MKQSIERQIRNIKEQYPNAVIVNDEYTGTEMDRPGWTKLYKKAKAGDVIVFDSVSRFSRNADEGFQVYEELFLRGVELIFLKEHHIDTATYKKAIDGQVQVAINSGNVAADELIGNITSAINKYLLALAKEQIRIALDQSEKEVEDLHQRTREGIREVKARNERILLGVEHGEVKQIGQVKGAKLTTKKSIKCKEIILQRSIDFNGTLPDVDVMKLTGLARGTYYKYKRELKADHERKYDDVVVDSVINNGLWQTDSQAWKYYKDHSEYAETLKADVLAIAYAQERSNFKKRNTLLDALAAKIKQQMQNEA